MTFFFFLFTSYDTYVLLIDDRHIYLESMNGNKTILNVMDCEKKKEPYVFYYCLRVSKKTTKKKRSESDVYTEQVCSRRKERERKNDERKKKVCVGLLAAAAFTLGLVDSRATIKTCNMLRRVLAQGRIRSQRRLGLTSDSLTSKATRT